MSHQFCDYLIDQLSFWSPVTARKMFGGYGIYRAGLMFGLIADNQFYLKVDDSNRADFVALGSEPFSYAAKGKKVTLSYWHLPEDVLEDTEQLSAYAEKAYAVALRARKNA